MANKLFVGNISFKTSEDDLQKFAEGKGVEVDGVQLMTDRETGKPRGFGFITLAPGEDSAAAIRLLNGSTLAGRDLTVNEARPMERSASRGRR